MSADGPRDPNDDPDRSPSDDSDDFHSVLHDLKTQGCNLLVVGDARRELFARASAELLGDADAPRYRLLATTDATPQSVAERLPDADATPRPLSATTKLVNHALPSRSATAPDESDTPPTLADVPGTRVADPQLAGLESELAESMAEFDRRADGLRASELRVAVDSLGPLLDHYEETIVRQFLRTVGDRVHRHGAMAHYVLRVPYGDDRTRSLVDEFDAVVEVRSVDPATHDHDAEERWHVPERDLTTCWIPL